MDKEQKELREFVGGLNRQPFTFEDVADAIYNAGYRKEDEVRKETAKEILKRLKFIYKARAKEYTNWDTNKVKAVTLEWLNLDIEDFAEDYGVEVDE